jgi:mismatch-specific thymine-DNA glycosylase
MRPQRLAASRSLPDRIAPGLELLFVGINPGRISAAAGHYYANPRNLFWPLLYESGLVPRELKATDDGLMPRFGLGLTDIVKRPSRGAGDLKTRDFSAARSRLTRLVERFQPRAVCFNGKIAFEGYFGKGACRHFGGQRVKLAHRPVFVLPSTSPANAGVPFKAKLRYFKRLKIWLKRFR